MDTYLMSVYAWFCSSSTMHLHLSQIIKWMTWLTGALWTVSSANDGSASQE